MNDMASKELNNVTDLPVFRLKIKNFLAVREAVLSSRSPITVLLGPNKTGKTQILLLLYAILTTISRLKEEGISGLNTAVVSKFLKRNLEQVFLSKVKDLISWGKSESSVVLEISYASVVAKFSFTLKKGKTRDLEAELNHPLEGFLNLMKFLGFGRFIYLQPAGLGDYYKGIFSLKKYYPDWKIVSSAVTDLIYDILIAPEGASNDTWVIPDKVEIAEYNKDLLNYFENLFGAKFFVQNQRIFVQETDFADKPKRYKIERTASGLKSLGFLFLILRYNLLDKNGLLLLDEPEVNLHPIYIKRLVKFITRLSKTSRIFVATHSDYFLESLNKQIKSSEIISVDVWESYYAKKDGPPIYRSYRVGKTADRVSIDTRPLIEVFLDLISEDSDV